MDFLAKNYDKLILAFCLIILVVGISFVAMSFQSTNALIEGQNRETDNKMRGGDKIEELQSEEYNSAHYLNDPRKLMNILGSAKRPTLKGSLIEPNKYIICVNEDCLHLISLNASKCPFCGTEQPELAKELQGGEDTDADKFENQYASKGILHPRNPNDARMDYDRDGFLNVEEFRHGTKLDSADDFPSLGYLLRVVKVFRVDLPLKLLDIDTNRKEDQKEWDIAISAPDPKTRKIRRFTCAINDKVAGYVVKSAGFTGTGDNAVPFAVIAPENAPDDTYRLEKGAVVKSKNLTVRMVYLMSRDRNFAQAVMRRGVIVKNVGDEFSLEKPKTTTKVKEFYKLVSADEEKGSATVALLKSEKGAVDKEIPLTMFKPVEDFISYEQMGMGGMGEMGPGGEGGGPMMGPGPGPGGQRRRPGMGQNRRME